MNLEKQDFLIRIGDTARIVRKNKLITITRVDVERFTVSVIEVNEEAPVCSCCGQKLDQ